VALVNEDEWISETYNASGLRTGEDSMNFMDKVLVNETNRAITATATAFAGMKFRDGIQLDGMRCCLQEMNTEASATTVECQCIRMLYRNGAKHL